MIESYVASISILTRDIKERIVSLKRCVAIDNRVKRVA